MFGQVRACPFWYMHIRLKYFLIGAAFGLFFPVGAIGFELSRLSLSFNLDNLQLIHGQNLILYMIDSAPLFLGLFALFGGVSKEKSVKLINELRETAAIIREHTDSLQRQTELSLQRFRSATEQLTGDYSNIESLNRSTYSDVSGTIEGTNEISTEIHQLRASLEQLLSFNRQLEKSNELMRQYFVSYLEKMEKIRVFFDYLKDFSRQIEALAVNSTIEANRYGAQGRAFMVFARDIHKLAGETRSRNELVMEIQREINDESNRLKEIIEAEHESLLTMSKLVFDADSSSEQFMVVINSFLDRLHEATTHLDEQNSLTVRFSDNLGNINEANTHLMIELRKIVERQADLSRRMNSL